MAEVKEQWRLKISINKIPWRIVSIENGVVGLSGPGPARSMIYVTEEDLRDEWEKVPEEPTSTETT